MTEGEETHERQLTRGDVLRLGAVAAATPWLASIDVPAARAAVTAGGTLRLGKGSYGSAEHLDPAAPLVAFEFLGALYNRLVKKGPNGAPAPDLATSWEASRGARTWTFRLRSGVTFHNGKALTSRDVAYSLRHVLDPATKSPAASVLGALVNPAAIQTPNPRTVVIPLKRANAEFPSLLMHYNMYIIPEDSAATIRQSGIGTGPFRLASYVQNERARVVRNPNYFGGRTNLDAVEFLTIADAQARVSALLADQIDLVYWSNVDFASARVIAQSSNCRVLEQPASDWKPLVMRTDRAPFRDLRVREAFKIAFDPKVLIRVVAQGHGTIAANNPVALDDQYRLKLKPVHDPERARSLLRSAGRSGLEVTLRSSSADPTFTPLAVAFKSEAAKAGIRVQIEQVPADQYWSTTWLKAPFCFSSWGGGRPADQLLNEIFRAGAPYNESYWNSARFGKLLDQARRTIDVKKRTELYQEAQRLLVRGSGDIVPFFSNTLRGMNKRVRNYREQGFELDWIRLAIS